MYWIEVMCPMLGSIWLREDLVLLALKKEDSPLPIPQGPTGDHPRDQLGAIFGISRTQGQPGDGQPVQNTPRTQNQPFREGPRTQGGNRENGSREGGRGNYNGNRDGNRGSYGSNREGGRDGNRGGFGYVSVFCADHCDPGGDGGGTAEYAEGASACEDGEKDAAAEIEQTIAKSVIL